jgi:GST-like protein
MAVWPWVSRFEWQGIDLEEFANVCRWYEAIATRDAVGRGYDKPMYVNDIPWP